MCKWHTKPFFFVDVSFKKILLLFRTLQSKCSTLSDMPNDDIWEDETSLKIIPSKLIFYNKILNAYQNNTRITLQ